MLILVTGKEYHFLPLVVVVQTGKPVYTIYATDISTGSSKQ